MTDNTVTLPALIQVGPVTAKVCSWSSQEGQPDHRPRSHTSFTWLSTLCPQCPQSPSNRRLAHSLPFAPRAAASASPQPLAGPRGRIAHSRQNALFVRSELAHRLV